MPFINKCIYWFGISCVSFSSFSSSSCSSSSCHKTASPPVLISNKRTRASLPGGWRDSVFGCFSATAEPRYSNSSGPTVRRINASDGLAFSNWTLDYVLSRLLPQITPPSAGWACPLLRCRPGKPSQAFLQSEPPKRAASLGRSDSRRQSLTTSTRRFNRG